MPKNCSGVVVAYKTNKASLYWHVGVIRIIDYSRELVGIYCFDQRMGRNDMTLRSILEGKRNNLHPRELLTSSNFVLKFYQLLYVKLVFLNCLQGTVPNWYCGKGHTIATNGNYKESKDGPDVFCNGIEKNVLTEENFREMERIYISPQTILV